ncbi:MAG TPA: glycerate kinase [Candidatus Sulfotelmatobacter sp.]|nr:glycerate kinase [Candidatus Sulfotelmatobacter sp.]
MIPSTRNREYRSLPQHAWRIRLRQDGSSPRPVLVEALSQALLAADPRTILRNKVKVRGNELVIGTFSVNLSEFGRVLVIGGGKATANMALEIERILDGWVTGGAVNIPAYTKPWPKSSLINFNPANHPVPSEQGVRGVKKMLELVGQPSEKDLVICLISGGGSALMPLPSKGLNLSDKQKTTQLLLTSGARIDEINAVRKHLSDFKGGRLAEKLYPATVVSLIISDVVGDRLDSIASGPTVPDSTTYSDAYNILNERGLWYKVPGSVRDHIGKGRSGRLTETPKEGSRIFKRVNNFLTGTNVESCKAAARVLERRGYRPLILSTRIQGEAREVGKVVSSIVSDIRENHRPIGSPAAIVAGGETTVTVRGKGSGGRNQELVLSAALSIRGLPNVLVSSIGTDGRDGPTSAAGAIADGSTVERGLRRGLDADTYLRENDSHEFFKKLQDLIITGPTGTNVNDILIAIVGSIDQKSHTTMRSVRSEHDVQEKCR